MANPQPVPFAQMSLELLESLIRHPFTARQYAVMLAVAVVNYGPKEKTKTAEITIAELAEMTGLHERKTRQTVAELVNNCALLRVDLGRKRFELGIQKNYELWRVADRNGPQLPDQNGPKMRTETVRKCGPKRSGSQRDTLLGSSKKTNKKISLREVVPRKNDARANSRRPNERERDQNERAKQESIMQAARREADEALARLRDETLD